MPDQAVRDYAATLAARIDGGDGPSFVLWSGENKVHVVIGRAVPPENSPTSLSLEQWRKHLRTAVAAELVELGWEIRGGNRFWREGTSESKPADTKQAEKHEFIAAFPAFVLLIAVVVLFIIGAVGGWLFDSDRLGVTAFICFGLAFATSLTVTAEAPISRAIRINVVGAVVGGTVFAYVAISFLLVTTPFWWFSVHLIFVPALVGVSAADFLLSDNPRSGIAPGLSGIWIAAVTTIGWLELWPIWMTLMLVFSLPTYIFFFGVPFVGEGRLSWRRTLSVLGVLGLITTLIYSIATKDWEVFGGFVVWVVIIAVVASKLQDKKKHVEDAKDRVKTGDKIQCPRCGSSQVSVNRKGFSAGKAAAGGLLVGGVGLLGGFAGSKKIEMTCLQCSHKWLLTAP